MISGFTSWRGNYPKQRKKEVLIQEITDGKKKSSVIFYVYKREQSGVGIMGGKAFF